MMVRAVLAGAAALLIATPAAVADPVPRSPGPLPGSSFLGGDGNQNDAPPYTDWQGTQAAGRVVHSPDPNAQDSAFVGGSKESLPYLWDLTTEPGGVSPSQVNILGGWSSVDQPSGDTFLYLSLKRQESGGTAYITFELNRDTRLWNNGHAKIPCRSDDDVLIVIAPQGNDIDVVFQQWNTVTTDPETGCARTGTLRTVESLGLGAAQGAVNSTIIQNFLPGVLSPGLPIPAGLFGESALNISTLLQRAFSDRCLAFGSMWMHSRSSLSATSNLQDYVRPQALSVRTCSASGTKFFDLDADGVRDPGEPALPRFLIWADYNNDGIRGPDEPFSVTDDDGNYVIDDIRPPSGSYRLREQLAPTRRRSSLTGWACSFPNASTPGGFANGPGGTFGCGWGPIVSADTPNAQIRDFGNWVPAHLTIEKQLWPADDPGRFDFIVNGQTVKAGAGDGDSITIAVAPGTYNVSEAASAGTDPAAYESSVTCSAITRRRGTLRSGPVYEGLVLLAGGQARCTFVNARPGVPGIAMEKTGPSVAEAGDTLNYTFYVTNPGDVALPASSVEVTDDKCDDPPNLSSKNGDTTPQTLDPGDTWTYKCSHKTAEPADDCVATAITNKATASGSVGGTTVSDDGKITTTLNCPDVPPDPPIPPQPGPDPEPGPTPVDPLPSPPAPSPEAPFAPPGPAPPDAGEGGIAGISASSARCITRASQVQLTGQRMSVIAVSVNGRRLTTRTLRLLQRRSFPLTRIFSPGRHVLTIRVTFERGSATAPVTLRRSITICGHAAQVPRVTG
jgi:hypothetical protein